jgi:hypothetical protein
VIQDINKPWPTTWHNTFSLVHQRLVLAGSGANGQGVVHALCELVKPGGWIQLLEADNEMANDDGPAHKQFVALLIEIFRSFGVEKPFVKEMAGWLRDEGFQNVKEEVIEYVCGKKMKEESLREQGIESTCTALQGLTAYARSKPLLQCLLACSHCVFTDMVAQLSLVDSSPCRPRSWILWSIAGEPKCTSVVVIIPYVSSGVKNHCLIEHITVLRS